LQKRLSDVEKNNRETGEELQRWKAAYNERLLVSERAELESEHNYQARIFAEKKGKDDCYQISSQVFRLRGAVEEYRVSETEVVGVFKQLCVKVMGCMHFLKFHLPNEVQAGLGQFRASAGFDSPTTSALEFIEFPLARNLMEIIMREAKHEFSREILNWTENVTNSTSDTSTISGYQNIEKKIHAKIATLTVRTNASGTSARSATMKTREETEGQHARQYQSENSTDSDRIRVTTYPVFLRLAGGHDEAPGTP
jgi:hypothetical protein